MSQVDILRLTRYDRLRMFYSNLKNHIVQFEDFGRCQVPKPVVPDKNNYRKYLKVPFNTGRTKQYYFTLYGEYYKMYKQNNNFYFIHTEADYQELPYSFIEDFYCSMAFSFIAMAIYELIQWLTGTRRHYKIYFQDEVFSPIFDFPQWKLNDYDCKLILTLRPTKPQDENTIRLSIFK